MENKGQREDFQYLTFSCNHENSQEGRRHSQAEVKLPQELGVQKQSIPVHRAGCLGVVKSFTADNWLTFLVLAQACWTSVDNSPHLFFSAP